MILRRLTKHVKDQNWFAVALDFVIVVVGILIAFQITNWSASRQDNLIYQQARTRVIEEARVNFERAQVLTVRVRDYEDLARGVIEDFETCRPDKDAETRLLRAMQTLRFYLGIEVRADAITQMLTSDAFLDNISSEDRTTLSVYARRLDRLVENDRFNANFQLTRQTLQDNRVFKRTLNMNPGDSLSGIQLNVSYEEACRDETFSTFLFDRLEHGTYVTAQVNNFANASREVLIGLGENLGETLPETPAQDTTL